MPCLIDGENHAVPVDADGAQGRAILRYMEQISETAGLRTTYRQSGRHLGGYRLIEAAG